MSGKPNVIFSQISDSDSDESIDTVSATHSDDNYEDDTAIDDKANVSTNEPEEDASKVLDTEDEKLLRNNEEQLATDSGANRNILDAIIDWFLDWNNIHYFALIIYFFIGLITILGYAYSQSKPNNATNNTDEGTFM